jgi:hypothetical protein
MSVMIFLKYQTSIDQMPWYQFYKYLVVNFINILFSWKSENRSNIGL